MVWYIFYNTFLRVFLFFKHWYIDSWYFTYGRILKFSRFIEKKYSIRINLHFLFEPLYQERNIVGYVLGFLFRLFIIIVSALLHLITFLFWGAIYTIWALIPIYIFYRIFNF